MSWVHDLKTIIDRMPDELPPFTPRGTGISGEPFIHRKVQRQRGTMYWYWTVKMPGRNPRYFPYTIDGLRQAIAYRDKHGTAFA